MSTRNLQFLFEPKSVAVIGASARPGRIGTVLWRNLRDGGFAGPRWAVNPRRDRFGGAIDGEPVLRSIAALPAAPELALICAPPSTVPGLVAELGARGTRAVVVLTPSLAERQTQAMLDAARKHLLRVLGPQCIGLLSPHAKLNASFAHIGATPGPLAFISQSGALATSMLDWAAARGIGFSRFVSLGERADIDIGDLLDWLAGDSRTRAILLYLESVETPRKFMSAARAAARNKPVLVVKAGRSPQGQAAASTHSAALATSDLVYDAAIRRAGMLRVGSLEDLFIAAETLTHFGGMTHGRGIETLERLTILGNGVGPGVLAADACAAEGIELAPAGALGANPIALVGNAPIDSYVEALRTLLDNPASGSVLLMHAPNALVSSSELAQALVPVAKKAPRRVWSAWLGEAAVAPARQQFHDAGIASVDTPEDAVRAFAMLVTYRRNQELLMQTPSLQGGGAPADLCAVRSLIDAALADGRTLLSEPEAKALLAACGVPVVRTRIVAATAVGAMPAPALPEGAVAAADEIGYPVALKILSPQVSHKSAVGGVALNLENADAVRAAAAAMLARVAKLQSEATIAGFTVQQMVRRPAALELIVGSSIDPVFGPVLLFGAGGRSVEVVADRALALPPLNEALARALIARTRIARLMDGWHGMAPTDHAAVVRVLIAISQLLADEPRIAEIDINPLLADADGVVALDARIRIDAKAPGGAARFTISPYPSHLVESFEHRGHRITLRPIRPEDEVQHLRFFEALAPEDVRMRMFYSRRTMEHSELARYTQIDYEREMAFVATEVDEHGVEQTIGVARGICDADNHDAEFGIVVRSDQKGKGIGALLMRKLIAYLRARGTRRLIAVVLRENATMLSFMWHLGFRIDRSAPPEDDDVVSIELPLQD